jgi:excisionase family DNA binding protein
MMRDADFGIVRLRAYGTYDFRIVDVKVFLREVAGTDHHFRLEEFADTMRSRLVSVFTDALASAHVPALDIATRYSELGEALLPVINPALREKYGLEMSSFIIENISLPPEVEKAIDKRSSMAAIGNLNDYVKLQMAEGLAKGSGGGTAGAAAEIAMGFGLAQQLMNQPGGLLGPQATPSAAAPAPAAPPPVAPPVIALLSPAEVAQALNVSEADVLTELTAGTLKGRKIGSAWRVSRAALEDFLRG